MKSCSNKVEGVFQNHRHRELINGHSHKRNKLDWTEHTNSTVHSPIRRKTMPAGAWGCRAIAFERRSGANADGNCVWLIGRYVSFPAMFFSGSSQLAMITHKTGLGTTLTYHLSLYWKLRLITHAFRKPLQSLLRANIHFNQTNAVFVPCASRLEQLHFPHTLTPSPYQHSTVLSLDLFIQHESPLTSKGGVTLSCS